MVDGFELECGPRRGSITYAFLDSHGREAHVSRMQTRTAKLEDAEPVVALLRRSIIELCVADHKSDPGALESWLRNKTIEGYHTWLANDHLMAFVVEHDGAIAGFGMATTESEVLLNYVSPEFRFRGVSKLILVKIEQSLKDLGVEEAILWSTETAHAFYRSRGWMDRGVPEIENGMRSYPMSKILSFRG